MPEEQGVYRVVGGRRYRFPNEERAKAFDSARESLMRQYASEEGFLSQAGAALKSVLPGVVRGTGLAATGIGSILESEAAKEAGRYLEEKAKQTSELFMEPYQRYTTGAMLGETLGAMAPAALATAAAAAAIPETGGLSATVIPGIAGGVVGMLQGAGEVGEDIQQARERGAQVSPEQEQKLALTQGLITGALEGLPLGRLAKGARSLATTGRIAMGKPAEEATKEVVDLLMAGRGEIGRRALKSAGIEGLTEGAQQLSQNLLAAGAIPGLGPGYDPTRGAFEGVLESAAVGSVFGGTLQGGIDLYNKKKLEGYLSKEREKQKESAEVGRQLEDAFISREIEGQRQAEVAQGILAEEAQKAAQEAAKQEGIKLDTSLTKALGVFSKEKATPEDKLDAYREFAAQDLFEKTYTELKGAEIIQANKQAYDFFKRSVNPESLALGIQMKEREAPGAVEMVRAEAPEGMGGVIETTTVEPTASGAARVLQFQGPISNSLFGKSYADLTSEQAAEVDERVKKQVGKELFDLWSEGRRAQEDLKVVEEQKKADTQRQERDAALSVALQSVPQEGATVKDQAKAYREIAAVGRFGSPYSKLRGEKRINANAIAQDIINGNLGIEDLDFVKEFRARQTPTEPVTEAPVAPEVEIAAATEAPQPAAPVEQVPEITEPVVDRETGVVSRPEDWDSMLPSQQLNWAKRAYPYAPQSEIESFVTNTDPRLGAEVLGYADRRIAKKNEEFRAKFPPAVEEGMAKLPKGKRPVVPTEVAAVQPERGTPIERAPRRLQPEPGLKLDVEAARGVSEKAYEQLKKLNVSDIYSTVVVDNFLDEKGEVKPDMAQFLDNVIKIASKQNDVATSEENLINTINHEVVHGMRNSGFFTDAEWNLLTTRFNPNDELDRDTIAAYRDRFKGQGPEVVQEKLQEEAVAHAIERLSNLPARDLDIPSVSMLTKVKSLARLGTAANNLGYNAEDLISAVRAGQVGRRAIKGAPTVLEAVREGRTPRQLMPQGRLQVGDVPEELPEMAAGPVDESEIPAELRGEAPERISKEAPEITEESREVPGTEASSPMYKIRPQKPAELFVERKDDSLVNMVQRGVSSGSPTLQILNDIKNYLFETKVAKAALGPESELGKAVSARQSVLDQYASVAKSAENLRQFLGPTADKYTAANSAAIVAIRQSQKVSELLSTMLLEGYAFFDPKTGFILVKKSKDHALMPQLENLAKKGKINQALDAAFARGFMETQRATGNAEAILGGIFSVKDYQAIEAKYAKDTDIQEFLRVYRNLNDALLELNRYVGNFDQATTQRYKRYFYTPRYRVPVDKDGYPLAPTASNAKIANLQGLKPIKGAKLPVADALENIISNAQFMLSYAMKNEAGVRTIRDAVDANIAKATGTAKAVKVREPKFAGDPGRVVRVNVKGRPEYYEVLDPLLYQAMVSSGFTPSAMDMVGRSFGRVFRSGITRSFPFAFGNMFLDSINLWSLGIYKGSPIVAIPRNLIEGGVSVFNSAFWKTDPALQELASAGLLPSDIAARNAIDTAKNIKKKLKIEQDESLTYLFSKVWDGSVGFMEKLASASETVNRVQVYKNVLKDMRNTGMSAEEAKATALYATMQYPVNFDTRGSGQIASWVASYLPFVSASAQGTDVFYRHIRDIVRTGKTRTLSSGRVIGGKQMSSPLQRSMIEASKSALYQSVVFGSVYSLLMAAFGWEEWKKLRLEERYRTLLVPIPVAGGGMMKIPVPPTLGAISLMIPAALAESIKGHENGAEIAKSMAAFFAGMFTFDPTPQFIRPAIEVATNKNFFTWRPIENESLQKLPPQYRYDERTNLLSRYMSKFLNEVAIPISPVQFEHLVRGYLGTLGVFANELISQTVDIKSQDEPERFRPFTDPHLLPGIGKIFLDPDVDRKAIDDYYAIRNAATQAANALKIEAASEEFQSNPEALREMLILSRINEAMEAGPEKEMQELRKLKRQVQSAPSSQISPSRKTDVIKKINSRMSQIAGSVQPLKRYVPFNAF